MFEINNAEVKGPREAFDETFVEQVTEITEHEAFDESNIKLMPDGHAGKGAVVGFTMPLQNKVVPNTVGVDIGCGITAFNLGRPERLVESDSFDEIDEEIREAVPTGRNTHSNTDYHLIDDFPWYNCVKKANQLMKKRKLEHIEYSHDYFNQLCERIEYDTTRAINSMGTLGGGNHFIEISKSRETDCFWVVVHSGSRGIGLTIANYWQDKATSYTSSRKTRDDLPQEIDKYLNENWKPKADKIREDFEGEEIQNKFDEISMAIQEYGPSSDGRNTNLDWLQNEEATGYLKDMIFAQQYARENRLYMCHTVANILNADVFDVIDSIHNYIDFEDMVIRKGATPARNGEKLVIPFNMAEGSIIAKGKGNDEWNQSAPHGAGRRGSRRWAFREFSLEEFEESMDDVFSTSVTEETIDEAPMAYKDSEMIQEQIDETAQVIDVLEPVINIKAEE